VQANPIHPTGYWAKRGWSRGLLATSLEVLLPIEDQGDRGVVIIYIVTNPLYGDRIKE
jgi:hypothetical protein